MKRAWLSLQLNYALTTFRMTHFIEPSDRTTAAVFVRRPLVGGASRSSRPENKSCGRQGTGSPPKALLVHPNRWRHSVCSRVFGYQCSASDEEGPVEAEVPAKTHVRASVSTPTPRSEVREAACMLGSRKFDNMGVNACSSSGGFNKSWISYRLRGVPLFLR